jgi:peptidoglycan/xylan/chitin deacetylase (PgdA/CDA1 family)
VDLGMEVGAHTVTHPILARLEDDVAYREIADGRDALRQITGEPISLFAYPNGVPRADYDERHVRMVERCGFAAACSTAPGVATRSTDRFQLPRFTPWDRARSRFAVRMARNLGRTKTEEV